NVEGVLRALGRLPFNQRAALVMRELEGRSYAEIADTLGVSVAAVETLIFRARRSLRVRTATLRSILTVPLPGSLAQLVEGGGSVAAGGIGAGMLIKAAVALVVGGLATGIGVERGTHAGAALDSGTSAPRKIEASPGIAPHPARVVRHTRPASIRPARAEASSGSPAVGRSSAPRPGAASNPAPSSTGSRAPMVTQTEQTVVETAEQTVTAVSASVPVSVPQVPQLPVQPPPLPELP